MSVGTESRAYVAAFDETAKIPIAQLAPDVDGINRRHIEADVALIWPYSSSTRRLSALLAEKDVRLRKSRGQVKITFYGACAREVAKTHLGIGDSIKLGLAGATWTDTGGEVSTPGRKVDWDIDIKKRVKLEIQQGGNVRTSIDITPTLSPEPPLESVVVGPKALGVTSIPKPQSSTVRFSPAHRTPSRLSSGSYIDASLDPFANDDDFVSGRGRKRTKFARHSGSWQLVNGSEEAMIDSNPNLPSSPLNQPADNFNEVVDLGTEKLDGHGKVPTSINIHKELALQSGKLSLDATHAAHDKGQTHIQIEQASSTEMGPPPIPSPSSQQTPLRPVMQIPNEDISMLTPVLRPLPSPGLALVSPLLQRRGVQAGYFPEVENAQSELEAIGHTVEELQSSRIDPTGAFANDLQASIPSTTGRELDPEAPVTTLFEATRSDFTVDEIDEVVVTGFVEARVLPLDNSNPHGEVQDDSIIRQSSSPIGQIANDPPEEVFDGVDLDALQQQIEVSNEQLHDSRQSSVVEQEDMYGPSIISPDQHAAVTATNSVHMDGTIKSVTFNDVSHPTASSVENDSSPTVNKTWPSQPAYMQEPQQPSATATLIDSSSDESENEAARDGEGDEEEDSTDDDDASFGTVSELENPEGGEEEYEDVLDEEEPTNDRLDVGQGPKAIAPTHREPTALLSPQPEYKISSPRTSQDELEDQASRMDGTEDSIEDELKRSRIRAMLATQDRTVDVNKRISVEESQEEIFPKSTSRELSPNGSETFSSELYEDEIARDEDQTEDHQTLLDGGELSKLEEPQIEPAYPEDLDSTKEAIHQQLKQSLIPITAPANLESELAISVQGSRVVPHLIDHQSILTPEATQLTHTSIDKVLPEVGILQTSIPLSPQPTQENDKPARRPMSDETRSTQADNKNNANMELPEQTPAETEAVPRASQRLSRKSLMSEKISSEYFTPRRSLRIKASSPPMGQGPFTTPLQPSSPRKHERTSRSVSPVVARIKEEKVKELPSLSRGISTPLSYFPRLSSLHEYFNLQVDVIAICTTNSTQPQKAKSGPKDHYTTLCLADTSFIDSNTTIRAQIFRPSKDALPTAKRGDVVLLRHMNVQTNKHRVMLLSTNLSAWAVFKQPLGDYSDVIVSGPPIEYADLESKEANLLSRWWASQGTEQYPDMPVDANHSNEINDATPITTRITRSQRRKTKAADGSHSAQEAQRDATLDAADTASSEVAEASAEPQSSLSPGSIFGQLPVSTMEEPTSPIVRSKRRGHQRGNSRRSESLVHELRDGTTYVDDGSERQRSNSIVHELRDGNTYVDE